MVASTKRPNPSKLSEGSAKVGRIAHALGGPADRRCAILVGRVRNPLLPRTEHVASRRWSFWVNTVAASPYVNPQARKSIYRRLGLKISHEAWEIGSRCYIHSSDIRIGERTIINDFCYFENVARITLGSGVGIGAHVAIITSNHDIGPSTQRNGDWHYLPVTIEDGCWIGARATILPGVTVGRGTIVAAGAVVTSDCEPNCIYGGVPARILRQLDE
jgi:maltose O-acetyltransferase